MRTISSTGPENNRTVPSHTDFAPYTQTIRLKNPVKTPAYKKPIFGTVLLVFGLICPLLAQKVVAIPESGCIGAAQKLGLPAEEIQNAYSLTDGTGPATLLLCARRSGKPASHTPATSLYAALYREGSEKTDLIWSLSDRVDTASGETDIRFMNAYCSFSDLDGDRKIDPVIVYATRDSEGYRRIRIFVLYLGNKYAIRATECELDDCRTFRADPKIGSLPARIKDHLNRLLSRMRSAEGLLLKNR